MLDFQYYFKFLSRNIIATKTTDEGLWASFPDYGFQHCRIPNWSIWEYFVFGNCLFHVLMFLLISTTILYKIKDIANLADISETNVGASRPAQLVTKNSYFENVYNNNHFNFLQ